MHVLLSVRTHVSVSLGEYVIIIMKIFINLYVYKVPRSSYYCNYESVTLLLYQWNLLNQG